MNYNELYEKSIIDPQQFWDVQAREFITWEQPWDRVCDYDFKQGKINWFINAKLNVTKNCLDRHVATSPNKVAIIWEGNDPKNNKKITYKELLTQVAKTANVLKDLGVKKGDRVCIYLPMIPEAVISMLACARLGAIHSVVFGGFSSVGLKSRILDSSSKIIITADQGLRGDKVIELKKNVDAAIAELDQVKHVLVVRHTNADIHWDKKRDLDYATEISKVSDSCECEIMNAQDPLFILYTSGSTGKPKGVVHTNGGYLTYVAYTFKTVFDYRADEVYWCTADVGWITGHSYFVYGPLAIGATVLMYEGIPVYPTPARLWEIIDKHKVNIFYTAPTLIRALMSHGDQYLANTQRTSLRILGTVGEPINPAAWEWFYDKVGLSKCPIVDTWWQTETGGILISPIPNVTKLKPGCATTPLFGIVPIILDEKGNEKSGEAEGYLAFATSWPGQMQTLYNDHKLFIEAYFKKFPGYYVSGDGARRDADGYYWITGRVDDVLNVSGHRIGTAEVESSLVKNPHVAEAAVVGCKDDITGEAIYAFVQLMDDSAASDKLTKELVNSVRSEIGAFAAPKHIQFVKELPKTRSGKILRRILRKIVAGDIDNLGDISALGNQEVIDSLLRRKEV